jgi:hypothetical protein
MKRGSLMKKTLLSLLIILISLSLASCGGGGGGRSGNGGGSGGSGGNSSDPTDIAASYTAHCGLRNEDGSVHTIPPPHQTTGKRISLSADNDNRTDERPVIQNAIDTAQPGDEVYLKNGTYNLNTGSTIGKELINLLLRSDVNLIGESLDGVILKTSFNRNESSVIRVLGVNNLTIENLTISSTWTGIFPDDPNTPNPNAGGPSFGIRMGGSTNAFTYNVTVQNVTVERFAGHAFQVEEGCHDIAIERCQARDATEIHDGGSGFAINGKDSGPAGSKTNPFIKTIFDCYFIKIDGCTIEGYARDSGSTEHGSIRHGVMIDYWAHNCLVINCDFRKVKLFGLDFHGDDEYDNELWKNRISGPSYGGVDIGHNGGHDKSGPHNWVHENIIDGCSNGIICQYGSNYQLIEKNNITNTRYSAIQIGKSDHTITRDNTIATANKGIRFFHNDAMSEEPAGEPTYCIESGNIITNTTIPLARGPNLLDANWATNQIEHQWVYESMTTK